ncbi:MAG: LysM peptidoglycan-binding domain-containing M23 family metallopeptidase [Chloroflexota bacterium]
MQQKLALCLFSAAFLLLGWQLNFDHVDAYTYECLPYVERGVESQFNAKGQKLHFVQSGESLLSIANQHCVTVGNLANVNLLSSYSPIRPGMMLVIPLRPTGNMWADGAIDHLTLNAADFPNGMPVNLRTQIIWPSVTHHLTQHFHAAHRGIDFAVLTGEPVRSIANGEVIRVIDDHHIYGRVIVIDHGNQITSVYGHLSEATVKEGFIVLQGENIGYSGNTGKSTGDHLHFEIRHDGIPLNPCDHLPGGCILNYGNWIVDLQISP